MRDNSSPTQAVIEEIMKGRNLEELLEVKPLSDVSGILNSFMGRKNLSTEALFERAGMSRSYGFRVMNGSRMPSRDALLRLALVLGMNIEQTQYFLKCGEGDRLSGQRPRDVLLMKAINDGNSLDEVDELLVRNGMRPLMTN